MGDYHNHLKKDVLFLADVFEKFFNPCHYSSSPGLSWDAMLKMTSVKLEKISDIDKYLVPEKFAVSSDMLSKCWKKIAKR